MKLLEQIEKWAAETPDQTAFCLARCENYVQTIKGRF